MGAEDQVVYLRRLVDGGAELDFEELLELRRERRVQTGALPDPGVEQAQVELDPEDAANERAAIEAQLAELRGAFWERAPEELHEQLSKLYWSAYPDLEQARWRLLRLANLADQVHAAGAEEGMDRRFFEALCSILAASEAERAHRKRLALAAVKKRALRRPALRSAKILRASYPDVYELEAEWFRHLQGHRQLLKVQRPWLIRGPMAIARAYFVLLVLVTLWHMLKLLSLGDG